jgi:myo-inositol-1(or 4)-monophosphatase
MATSSYHTRIAPLLRHVREIVLPYYGQVPTWRHKTASAADVVTDLDLRVETFLAEALRQAYPAIAFVGEETGGDRTAERFWLVDPIDGTGHFLRGLPFCTTMLALIEHHEVVFAAIYAFVSDQLYLAEKGRGATLNGVPIRVSTRPLQQVYLAWEMRLETAANQGLFQALAQRCLLVNTISAGFEYAMIAAGKFDGRVCVEPYGHDYDFAPGALLVAEAGGRVANVGVQTYNYRNLNFLAANPCVFDALTRGPEALFPLAP